MLAPMSRKWRLTALTESTFSRLSVDIRYAPLRHRFASIVLCLFYTHDFLAWPKSRGCQDLLCSVGIGSIFGNLALGLEIPLSTLSRLEISRLTLYSFSIPKITLLKHHHYIQILFEPLPCFFGIWPSCFSTVAPLQRLLSHSPYRFPMLKLPQHVNL